MGRLDVHLDAGLVLELAVRPDRRAFRYPDGEKQNREQHHQSDPGFHADDAGLCLSDSGCSLLRNRDGSRGARVTYFRDPADRPLHESGDQTSLHRTG